MTGTIVEYVAICKETFIAVNLLCGTVSNTLAS